MLLFNWFGKHLDNMHSKKGPVMVGIVTIQHKQLCIPKQLVLKKLRNYDFFFKSELSISGQ